MSEKEGDTIRRKEMFHGAQGARFSNLDGTEMIQCLLSVIGEMPFSQILLRHIESFHSLTCALVLRTIPDWVFFLLPFTMR